MAGEKMTLRELNELLVVPVRTIEIQSVSSEDSEKEVQSSISSPPAATVESIRYSRAEMLDESFVALFKDLLIILYKESGKTEHFTREIVALANASNENFFDTGRHVESYSMGYLMTRLEKDEVVVRTTKKGSSSAGYRLVESATESEPSVTKPLVNAAPKQEQPVASVSLNDSDVTELKNLLQQKEVVKKAKEDSYKEWSDAKQTMLDAELRLQKAEIACSESSDKEEELDKKLAQYRSLYEALSSAFGQS